MIVCHDAGGANIVQSLASMFGWLDDALPIMAGPAATLWADRFPERSSASRLSHDRDMSDIRTLITGTGWQSDLEHRARFLARKQGIHSITVLDHWAAYRERFTRRDREILPDEIWVTDRYAMDMAMSEFADLPIRLVPNPYLDEQVAMTGPTPIGGDLLFVSEPARSRWGGNIEGEFQALDYLAANFPALGIDKEAPLRIRKHPSEDEGKYDAWIAQHPNSVLDDSRDMARALKGARWVAGLQSFGLVIALAAGREVFSVLPPNAPPCRLPHAGIVHLRHLAC